MNRDRRIGHKPQLQFDEDTGKPTSTRIGQYSDDITAQLAKEFQGKVVSVRDIVRVQYGRLSSRNEPYVRRKITNAVNLLLKAGIPAIPIYEPEGRHKVVGIKVLTEYNEEDMELLNKYQEAAVARGELSLGKAELVKAAAQQLTKPEENKEGDGSE